MTIVFAKNWDEEFFVDGDEDEGVDGAEDGNEALWDWEVVA